jgi:polysaccharide export outer membrane protein
MNTRRCSLIPLVIWVAGALIALPGCSSPKSSTIPDRPTAAVSDTLAAGDLLRITFIGNREFDQAQRIRPDGKISLPMIGEVEAAGKRLRSVQADLSRLYKPHLQNNEVLVSLENTSAVVYVSGAVGKAGRIPFDRPMTAFEAIMEAGGFSPGLANPKKVILIRNENGKHQTRILDLSPALKGETSSAFYLKPYDTLQVPERFF